MINSKILFRGCLSLLLLLYFLTSCQDIDESETAVSQDITNLVDSSFTIQKAMETLYGSEWVLYDSSFGGVEDRIAWDIANASAPIFISEAVDHINTVFVKALYSDRFQEAGQEKILLITEATLPNNQCNRACSSVIGGAIFLQTSKGWEVAIREDNITTLGGWRNGYGNGSLVRLGPEKYGFRLNRFLIGTGFQETRLMLITEVDGKMQIVLDNVFIGIENEPCGQSIDLLPCRHTSSTIHFESGTGNTFNDLYITTTSDDDVDLSKTIRIFRFVDGQYQLSEQREISGAE